MIGRVVVGGLSVAKALYDFIGKEVLPGTGIPEAAFWTRFDRIIHDLAPKNRALLRKRDELQARIDDWHRTHKDKPVDLNAYTAFLKEIGYLLPEPATQKSESCRRENGMYCEFGVQSRRTLEVPPHSDSGGRHPIQRGSRDGVPPLLAFSTSARTVQLAGTPDTG